jgi:hypothetical protein
LGSPLNLANKIAGGFKNFIILPAKGLLSHGLLGAGKGLAIGASSLVTQTIDGAFGSV